MKEVKLILANKLGLHARPAAEFTKAASKFKCKVTVEGNGKTADAKSIILMMSMGVKPGQELTIRADGVDENECIQLLSELIENRVNKE